jgi:hypothetical protein
LIFFNKAALKEEKGSFCPIKPLHFPFSGLVKKMEKLKIYLSTVSLSWRNEVWSSLKISYKKLPFLVPARMI